MAQTMVRKEDYELCEDENSNLRKCLAWAGRLLTQEQRLELRKMIERPIGDGGVVGDSSEDDWNEGREIKRLCVKAAEIIREAVETDDPVKLFNSNWTGRADAIAGQLMAFDPPSEEACLAEIRNCSPKQVVV